MAITPTDFEKIWSSNATTPAYTFSDADYLEGWDFVGNLPPTRAQWNAIQKRTDEKMKYIFDNFGAPLVANTVADMTEQNRVYVYTGSETGYTAGDWYYYDAGTSAWVDGGVYNAIAVQTDTTLTQAGEPADAKVTGDKINGLQDIVEYIGYTQDITNLAVNTAKGIKYSDGTDATASSYANYHTTDLIPVKQGWIISYTSRTNANACIVAFYDSYQAYVQASSVAGTGGNDTGTYTVATDGYVKLSARWDYPHSLVLTISGHLAEEDAKLLGEINDVNGKLTYLCNTNNALWFDDTVTGERLLIVDCNLKAGKYQLDISSIASTDTDSTVCLLQFNNTITSTVVAQYNFARGVAVSQTVTLSADVNKLYFYGSNTSAHAVGDTFAFNGVKITSIITDTTLSVEGGFADAKTVGGKLDDVNKQLQTLLRDNKALWFDNTVTGTRFVVVDCGLSVGTYQLDISSITSTDTDSNVCLVQFVDSINSQVVTYLSLARGVAISQTIALSSNVDKIYFYGADTSAHAVGDTFAFNDVQIWQALNMGVDKTLNVLLMGDSIFGNDGEIAFNLNEMCNSCVNGAFGGTRVSVRSSGDFQYLDGVNIINALCTQTWTDQDTAVANLSPTYPWMTSRLAGLKAVDMSKIDLLIMDWGTNDYTAGATIEDITTAYNTVIDALQTAFPELRILICTPIWRYWGTEADNENGDNKVYNVSTLKEIALDIEQFAKDKRISVLNAYQNLPLSYKTASTYFDAGQSTHLNAFGNRVYAHLIHGKIVSMY